MQQLDKIKIYKLILMVYEWANRACYQLEYNPTETKEGHFLVAVCGSYNHDYSIIMVS